MTDDQVDILNQALEIAGPKAESKKRGHLLSLVCQTFVADNMNSGPNPELNRERMIRRLGAMYEIDLIAVDPRSGKVLVGNDVLKKVVKKKG